MIPSANLNSYIERFLDKIQRILNWACYRHCFWKGRFFVRILSLRLVTHTLYKRVLGIILHFIYAGLCTNLFLLVLGGSILDTAVYTYQYLCSYQASVKKLVYIYTTINKTSYDTGWPKSKFANSNGYNSVNMHFWPDVGKAKMCLAWHAYVYFDFSAVCLQFPKINLHLNTFWLHQNGVKNAYLLSYSHLN